MRFAASSFALTAIVVCLAGCPAIAATITGMSTTVTDSDFDLTALGTADWAYWNSTDNPVVGGAITNRKSGGSLISNIAPVGGGSVRGSTSTNRPAYDFTFINGSSPTMGTVDDVIGLFNTQLDTVGSGVSLSVSLPTVSEYTVYVWAASNGVDEALFTAALDGTTDFTNTDMSSDNVAPKDSLLYTLTVTPDSPDDILDLSLVLIDDASAGNSNVLISGVAVDGPLSVSNIPEPLSIFHWLIMVIMGVLFSFFRRRLCNKPARVDCVGNQAESEVGLVVL